MLSEHIGIETFRDGALYLIGDVKVQVGDMFIHCENLVAWLADPKAAGAGGEPAAPPIAGEKTQDQLARAARFVKEIYAEGTVIFSQGEEWVRADRVFFDLANSRGLVIDATLAYPLRSHDGRTTSLVVQADELRILSQDRLQASGVKVSTCSFGHPHYHLASSTLEIIRERPGTPDPADPDAPLVENYHLEARGNVLHLGSFPVFWLPDFAGDSAARRPFEYIEDVRLGHTNRFGYEIGLTVGDDIRDGSGKWGHWSVPVQWYSKRGFGGGVDLLYGAPQRDYEGALFTNYQRDHGDDRFFGKPPTENRGRISWYHRHRLPWEVQLDLELQLFSDRGYYPTYFEDQEKGLKPPENLAYLKKTFFNSYLTALYTIRFNDWETVREYQPELRYDLVYEPLFDLFDRPVYLDATVRVSKNRLEIDEDLETGARGTWRVDLDALLEYPVPVGPFTLTPFAGPRYTWYEEDLFERRDEDRIGVTAGATLALQAFRIYDVFGGLFDLDGLRHVVYPELTFRNTSGVRLHPDELIPFDEVDAFDNTQSFELSVRNLFQTVRHRTDGATVENVIDLDSRVAYFPNAGRDHDGEPWSNLVNDLIVRFSDDLQIATDAETNFYGRGMEIWNAAVGYTPSRDFQAYAGFRHFHDTYDAVFLQGNHRLDEKWLLTIESSYDFRDDRGLDHRFVLSRIGHDWVFQFGFKADVGENDYGFSISFEPRLFFNPTLKARALRSEPRLLYLGSGLTN